MPNTTTNYSLLKPLVADPIDEDLWGGYLNDDMDDIDTLLKQGITLTAESSQTSGFTAVASISVKKLYPCDATSAAFAATLPTAASAAAGAVVFFKKTDATANAVTITRAGSDTIDGATTLPLSSRYAVAGLQSDGVSSWNVIVKTDSVFTGDSGSGGTAGLVPAPAAGDAADFKTLFADGAWDTFTPNVYQASPANPTGTTSTTGVMQGLAGSLTPNYSGVIEVTINGLYANNNSASGAKFQIRYGTGSAPANGAALTGTTAGALLAPTNLNNSSVYPFSTTAIVSGLTPGTAYWIDISLAAIAAGTAALSALGVSVKELK